MRREAPEGVVFDPCAPGSEVHPCLEARELLAAKRIAARVVSLPCFEIFDDQPEEYREWRSGSKCVRLAHCPKSFGTQNLQP